MQAGFQIDTGIAPLPKSIGKGGRMIKDRRYTDHYIPINFNSRESFSSYPESGLLTMTLVTDGAWKFTLNHTYYCLDAPFILCLNDSDIFSMDEAERAAAKTFVFAATFLNSSLTRQALADNKFEKIEDMHDRNLVQVFLCRNEHYAGLLSLNAPSAMQMNASMSVIGTECISQSDGKWTCRIRRYLLQMLYLLEDEFQISFAGKKSEKRPIDYALEYIHSNYHLGLTLDGISKYVGLNRTSLNSHCKQATGMTIIQYLNSYRTKMAEDALRHTNLNLSEIAVCCGYNYESYFIKTFTEKHGISPTEYRRLSR